MSSEASADTTCDSKDEMLLEIAKHGCRLDHVYGGCSRFGKGIVGAWQEALNRYWENHPDQVPGSPKNN